MSDRLRIGLLGCGSFAQRHAQNLQKLSEQVEMVAFCNRHIEKAVSFARQFGGEKAAVYSDHHEMFKQSNLDALVITLPPFAHSDEVQIAAERGIHIFTEKPIALRSDDGWRMVEAAEKGGITTQVGFMFRFGEAIETLKSLVANGTTGPLGLMSARYFCNSLHTPWWRDRTKSGGQLVEQVIHMVDLMRYLMGEPVTVYSRQENIFHRDQPDYTVEDVSATIYGFSGGGLGVIYATNGAIPNRWINDYRVVAQNVTADFQNANNATLTFTGDPNRPPLVITSERDVYLMEMRDFLRAVQNGSPTRTPIREGAMSLDMALVAARSARERKEVSLS